MAAEEDKKLGVFSLDLRKAMIIFLISLLLFATPAMAQKASESATQTGAMTKIYIAYCQNQKAMTERACKCIAGTIDRMVLDPTERAATYMVTLGDSVGYSLIYPTIMDKFGFRMRQKKLNWVVDSGECADAK